MFLLLLSAFWLSCHDTRQQPFGVENVPDPKKNGGGYVSNPDHLVSDETVSQLNQQLAELDRSGKAQVAVVVLHSIGQNDTRDFVHRLFNYWKPGDKAKNNGLVILMVEDARKLEFETGYGLEADLPDVICFRIQQDYMIPHIKQHDYDAGFIEGIKSVASLFNNGNYAYDQLPDQPALDTSLVALNPVTVAPPAAAITEVADSAREEEAAIPESATTASAPQQFSNNASNSFSGNISFWTILVWLFITAVMVNIFFGKKLKKKSKDESPATINDLPNEFLHPGITGMILLNLGAWAVIGFLAIQRHMDVGILMVSLIYYLVWVLFIHIAILIIAARAAMMLKNSDRHGKWGKLAILQRDIVPARYIFPLPYLWLWLAALKNRLEHLRNDPYQCPNCSATMEKLDEATDNRYLDKAQVIEEQLHSVDYDVWQCNSCHTHTVLDYANVRTSMAECPSCNHITYKCYKAITKQRATTSSEGWGVKEYECAACKYKHDYMFTIPKISSSSSGSSSSSSSFSSDSSSSSSDWGGGSSGGGGASSSW